MPFEISYRQDGGVVAIFKGKVTGDEIIEVNKIFYATDQKTRDIKYQLVDFREVETFDVSSGDVQKISRQDTKAAEVNPSMLVAIVAAGNRAYGMSRMWQGYTAEISMTSKVFRTLAEAEQWLKETTQSSILDTTGGC